MAQITLKNFANSFNMCIIKKVLKFLDMAKKEIVCT